MIKRLRPVVLAVGLALAGSPAFAVTFAMCDFGDCDVVGEGAQVGAGTATTDPGSVPGAPVAGSGSQGRPRRTSESTRTPGCAGNDPNDAGAYDVACQALVSTCQVTGAGPGPLTWIWSRPLDAAGIPAGRWVRTGMSCNVPPDAVDGAPPRPQLTIDMIRTAFREVDFAPPTLHVQPEGGVTLVNLPTYFEVQWPSRGYEPDEIATVNLLGRSVRIRPLQRSYTYQFGDGTKLGPTDDAGGTYPAGTIRHTYTAATGSTNATVSATYGGEFSVDGGDWQDVGDTVAILGPATDVTVREARARLEAG